jgi:hypothetical protein
VNLPKLAVHHAMHSKKICTVLMSVTSATILELNLELVSNAKLTEVESKVLEQILSDDFPGRMDPARACWTGVEVAEYWEDVGKQLMCQRLYPGIDPEKVSKEHF